MAPPPSPGSDAFKQELEDSVVARQLALPESLPEQRLRPAVALAVSHCLANKRGPGQTRFTVEDVARIINMENAHAEGHDGPGPRRGQQGAIRQVLTAMHNHRDLLRPGHDYEGEMEMTKRGTPMLSSARNKAIVLLRPAILFGALVNEGSRIEFLRAIFDALECCVRRCLEMQEEYRRHMERRQDAQQVRGNGAGVLHDAVCNALGCPVRQAISQVANTHKKDYPLYFGGLPAIEAFRFAGLVDHGATWKAATPITKYFTEHGALTDNYRLSVLAEAVRGHLSEFEALGDGEAKKRKLKEIMDACHHHFQQNNVFQIPLLTQAQQIRAFVEMPVAKRARRA